MEENFKKCRKCKLPQPLSQFHKNKTRTDGYSDDCKLCRFKHNKQYAQSENGKNVIKRIRGNCKENLLLCYARRRAKDKKMEFSITIDDIVIPEKCPVLGIPLFRIANKHCPNSPSLDRIDNLKGYTKDNICVI